MGFAENMRRIRTEKKMTQRDVSDKTRLTLLSISNYENKVSIPSIENAAKIAKALGVTVNDLLK